ncbi:hypothetical protein C5167_017825 [Papaver somniferum]|uniref:Uncharacterized protein n=1 Tax=Papaver somniferum TaxID=3469 RepID=A0A4Y7INW4_PAPSO|nr:hypothetical protein C5167_017825 [Papaver somniferum]
MKTSCKRKAKRNMISGCPWLISELKLVPTMAKQQNQANWTHTKMTVKLLTWRLLSISNTIKSISTMTYNGKSMVTGPIQVQPQ